jgi:hypothetical protein
MLSNIRLHACAISTWVSNVVVIEFAGKGIYERIGNQENAR